MNYREAKLEVDKYSKTINLDVLVVNGRPRVIAIKHFDGSYLEFHSAVFYKLDDEWMAVFTEHHGYHVYHFEDVEWIRELNGKDLYRYEEKE